MTKTIEFENKLNDLITETFETKEQLMEGIKYFTGTDLGDILKETLSNYEELE
jgi:hypothetical protein